MASGDYQSHMDRDMNPTAVLRHISKWGSHGFFIILRHQGLDF